MTITKRVQTSWARVKFGYHYPTSMVLTADYQLTGYEVSKMLDRLETTSWRSSSANDQYIYDTGTAGTTTEIDYIALSGHNLFTAGAEITLQYSNDNFSADEHDAFTAETPTSDDYFFKQFDAISDDYWRLEITGASIAPQITIGYWGQITELDWVTSAFDPNQRINKDTVLKDRQGRIVSVFEEWTERRQSLTWKDIEPDIYDKLDAWFTAIGKQNFFSIWESDQHSDEIYLMHCEDGSFNNPMSENGRYRSCKVNLVGRSL